LRVEKERVKVLRFFATIELKVVERFRSDDAPLQVRVGKSLVLSKGFAPLRNREENDIAVGDNRSAGIAVVDTVVVAYS
jgi:hypothetical protein